MPCKWDCLIAICFLFFWFRPLWYRVSVILQALPWLHTSLMVSVAATLSLLGQPWWSPLQLCRLPLILLGCSLVLGIIWSIVLITTSLTAQCRFLIGFGFTFAGSAAPLLVTEIAFPSQRGQLTSVYNSFWCVWFFVSQTCALNPIQVSGEHSVSSRTMSSECLTKFEPYFQGRLDCNLIFIRPWFHLTQLLWPRHSELFTSQLVGHGDFRPHSKDFRLSFNFVSSGSYQKVRGGLSVKAGTISFLHEVSFDAHHLRAEA